MGCDIHTYVEVKTFGVWKYMDSEIFLDEDQMTREPFSWRSYRMFGFLADVRNLSQSPVIAPRIGKLPPDVSNEVKELWEDSGDHSLSYLTLKQLLEYNYDQEFEDLRVVKQLAPGGFLGSVPAEKGEGTVIKLRDFLGEQFFGDIEVLKTLGAPEDVRIIFWFDS